MKEKLKTKQFDLGENDFIELNKLLKITGLAETGGQAGMMILEGLVKLNNVKVIEKRKKIRKNDVIKIGQEVLKIT